MSDLTVYKGLAWQRLLTVTNRDTGAAVDLTGATIILIARRDYTDEVDAFTLEVGSGITLLTQSGDTLGQATVDISSLISSGLAVENYAIRVTVQPAGEDTPQIVIPWRKLPVRP